MTAYADLIPGTSPARKSAYDDLLPGSVPAAPERPAEVAAPAAEPTALPGAIRRALTDIEAAQPARAVASPRGGIRIIAPDPNPPAAVEEAPTAAWSDVAKAIIPGAGAQIRSAIANLRRMANQESIAQREEAVAPQTAPGGGTLPLIVQRGQERQRAKLAEEIAARAGIVDEANAAKMDLAEVTPKDMSTTQRAVFSAGTSAPTTLAAMATGILTRNPALAMAIGGGGGSAIQAGSTYGEALDKGATHRQASVGATIDGLIEGLDALPIGVALKAGSPFMVRVAKTLGTEGLTEGGQQVLQDLRAKAMEDPNLTLGEIWDNAKVAMLAGAIGGGVHGTIGAAAQAGRPAMTEPQEQPQAQAEPAPVVMPAQPIVPPVQRREEPVQEPTPAPAEQPGTYDDLIPKDAAPAANDPDPWEASAGQDPTEAPPLPIDHPDVRTELQNMADNEAGWAEIGGRLIRRQRSEVAGDEEISRSKWIPRADWWQGRPGGLNEAQTKEAVRKAMAGEPLKKREQQAIDYMLEVANQRLRERQQISDAEWSTIADEITAEGMDTSRENIQDADRVAKASEIDPDAVEAAAMKYENDDAAFMAEIQRIIDGHQANQDAAAARRGQEDRGAPQEEAGPGFELEQQTEGDLAAREQALREAEAQRVAQERAAADKAAADRQRADFTLTGSDRAADENPNQRSIFGMPADAKPRRTDTPKFKRWFGDSKVVDEKGEPLVVYHGTTRDFSAFDPEAPRTAIPLPGIFFSPSKDVASLYASIGRELRDQDGFIAGAEGGNVMPVYLSIENPASLNYSDRGGKLTSERVVRADLEAAIKAGHDGAIIRGWADGSGPIQYVVFKPTQIKSAIGNSGEYSSKNPSILGSPQNTPTTSTVTTTPPTVAPVNAPTAAGATPPARARVQQQGARPDAIRMAMRELFGAPINEKGVGKKYLGIYRVKPQTIRLQNRNDLETASHEIGHHISNTNRPLRKAMRANAQELISIAPRGYLAQMQAKHGSLSVALQDPENVRFLVEEGFAEFISYYLNDPNHLAVNTPQFLKAFEGWLGGNPTIAKSLAEVRGMIGAHQSLGPADKMMAKVGAFEPGIGARIKDAASRDTWETFVQATLDRWAPLQSMVADLAPGVEASRNPYLAARLLSGDAAVIEDWINDFTVPFDYQQRLNPKNYGKPLKKILEPVLAKGDEEVGKFKAYLIARRAAELKKVGKENLFTKEEIDGALKLETSEFKKVAAEIYEYNDRLLAYAQQGGLLSAETVAKFKEYENYIPFFREPDGDAPKGDGRGNPFKRLTGGTANVRDPIANLIQNTANIIHATNRNAMVQKAVALAVKTPGGGRWLETVKVPQEAHAIATQRIIEQLQEQGIQVDTSMASNMAAVQTFFTPSGKGDDRTRTIVYKSGGDLKAVQVNDPLLWKTLGNIPPVQMGLIGKILAFPAQTLRAGVVLDPTFMVRNGVRDTLSATVQSRGKFLPVLSTAQGIKMMAQQKDAYKLWRAFGGAFSDQFRDAEEAGAVVERMAKRGSFSPSSIITPTRWLDALKHVGSFTESGSRIAEFEATYKPGDIDSALQAALNSREVSTDFGMRGGHEVVQVLTRLTPFMNPAMQGLYKTARVLSGGDGRAAAAKAAIVGANMALLSVALALLNSDGDWYQRLEEWEKATYWHFKLGDNVYRIPKPFEYGALFASVPEAIALRAADAEDGETFKKRMLQVLGQVLGFRMIPQTVAIVAEPWANKSLFTGRPIVPDRQEHLEPGLQSTPGTSKSAQVIGETANVSPAVIDNVVRNVFGTLGVHVATAADMMVEASGAVAPGRAKSWQSWPVLKAFVHDPDNPNTKQQTEFFDALQKYRRAVASLKELETRGDEAKADAYRVANADKLERAKAAEATAKRLAKIRKAIRAIEADRNMSPQEKREAINEQNLEIRELVEEQTPLYQQAKNLYGRSVSQGAQ